MLSRAIIISAAFCDVDIKISITRFTMQFSDNRAVYAIKIWRCAILLCHQQVSDAHEW